MGLSLRRYWLCVLLGSLGGLCAGQISRADTGEVSFFPMAGTVVLLAGLPGDLENETRYREQMQAWIELATLAQPRKILVLADASEGLKLPETLAARFIKADRSNFVALAETLKGTEGLLVIAWGHGGKQGRTPVFHVRGPRLTPADFRVVAEAAGPASRWVLQFRGSGAFARELAGAGRALLSSEAETMFSSDPVGMNLLLQLTRDQPATSFEKLAGDLGRSVQSWYAERNLARTEEPTVWLEGLEPRLLAVATSEPKESAEADQPPQPAKTNARPHTEPLSQERETRSSAADLPAAWKGIESVKADKYPSADAITIRRRLSYTLGSAPAVLSEQEEFIQILSPEGKRFGDFDISYHPPEEEMEIRDCEVLSPEGKLSRLDPEAIREAREPSVGDYQNGRRKFFSLPGVVPGAILHVRYRKEWKKFPLPHVSMEIPISLEVPALESTIEVSVPKDRGFHFVVEGISAGDPEIKQGDYGSRYVWRFAKVAARPREVLSAPHRQARLLISTFPDWGAFAEWYGRITKLTDEVTPEIAAKAAELTREAKNDRDKVLAIYNYVTSLRYVAVPLGVNSFRPHAAANVLANQFGDCKDKANLFNTMLASLKMDACLVLVPRFSQAHEAVPGLSFNHAISRVKMAGEGEPIWVDTTEDVCRFGLLPPGDPGRKVLVIDGQSRSLTQLPRPHSGEHRLKLSAELNCARADAAIPITLRATGSGYVDYELRSAAQQLREHASSLPLLASRFEPVAGSFSLDEQSATRVAALDENFTWRAEGACVGISTTADGKWTLQSPFWMPKEWALALHRRETPLFLNEGYPLTLEEEFQFTLPAGSKVLALPPERESKAEPLRWRIEWAKMDGAKLATRFNAELVRAELSESETRLFQEQLRELLAALAAGANLSLPQ